MAELGRRFVHAPRLPRPGHAPIRGASARERVVRTQPPIWRSPIHVRAGDPRRGAPEVLRLRPGAARHRPGRSRRDDPRPPWPQRAGKTTAVRILATLLNPDGGQASVAGHNLVREADEVRAIIGLTGQYAAVDENLTGRENLELVGRLLHVGRMTARVRADELLEEFDLSDAARRPVRTYSGGMRRRLDLAASLVGHPAVLYLDEPTTGLDPRSRVTLWEIIARLVAAGTTILLTTQYLEEADRLADRIAVIDEGRVIAAGTSSELKDRLGEDVVELRVGDRSRVPEIMDLLRPLAAAEPRLDRETALMTIPVQHAAGMLAEFVRRIDATGVEVSELSLHRPSLDDVFLALTGRRTAPEASSADEPGVVRRKGGSSDRRQAA
ncbi:MAG TPA: ATP-binding cassette domain-containing protein [Candidatus Limnocylindrales bacterium]